MRVWFKAAGTCHACGGAVTGLVSHAGKLTRHGARVVGDDAGIAEWSSCASGCPPWKVTPVGDLQLTGVSSSTAADLDPARPGMNAPRRRRRARR